MHIKPGTQHQRVTTFHPDRPGTDQKEARAAARVGALKQDLQDRLTVAMSRDQIDLSGVRDKADAIGKVDIDHNNGQHSTKTNLEFSPDSKKVASFSQTVKMSTGAAAGAVVFAAGMIPGPVGLTLHRTQIVGNRIQENQVVTNSDGTVTFTETTNELDLGGNKPSLEDLGYGEVGRDFTNRDGYDENFLGSPLAMPKLGDSIRDEIAPRLDEPDNHVLDYTHYSVIMNGKRRLPLVTAVNIDGSKLVAKKRQNTKWELDNRIARNHQIGNALYVYNDLDRGHMVRRLDPVWGDLDTATLADYDTFTYNNSNPQHLALNRKEWVGLEDHVLEHARDTGNKMTVFTGSINRADDPLYDNNGRVESGIQIPLDFFKIAVTGDGEGGKRAVAFILSQKDLVNDLIPTAQQSDAEPQMVTPEELSEALDPGRFRVYQVPVTMVEGLTDLDFGDLQESDVLKSKEQKSIFLSEFQPSARALPIDSLEDVYLGN
jgi:DNA/RNA endonuclease G (NUC1)